MTSSGWTSRTVAAAVFDELGDVGGVLPRAVTSTDKPAPFNGERGGSADAALSAAAAAAEDDDDDAAVD